MTSGKPLYALQGVFDSSPLAAVPGPLWHTKFDNFAPRIGAAYQITPKTVLPNVPTRLILFLSSYAPLFLIIAVSLSRDDIEEDASVVVLEVG